MTDHDNTLDPDTRAMLTLMDAQVQHDKYFRRLGVAGWAIATLAMLGYAVVSFLRFMAFWEYAGNSGAAFHSALGLLVPFLAALGGIGILLALLAATALVMRARSASLKEISRRLTNLEDMVLRTRGDD